jgi:hypothetical protein
VIPPLPRYIFASCCNDPEHCANLKKNRTTRKKCLQNLSNSDIL